MSSRELLLEIDETIDQLIENAIALETISKEDQDYALEKNLLEQMQESLLAHLFHLDHKVSNKKDSQPIDYKKIKDFSLEQLDCLQCKDLLKKDKVKLSKKRLKSNISKVVL